jgi:hypothetical protein
VYGLQNFPCMDLRSAGLPILFAATVLASGCVSGSPGDTAQEDQSPEESFDLSAPDASVRLVVNSSGTSTLHIENIGRNNFSTGSIRVDARGDTFECGEDTVLMPSQRARCGTSFDFPSQDTVSFEISIDGEVVDTYSCEPGSKPENAC